VSTLTRVRGPLDVLRAIVYRLGVRPHSGSILFSPSRSARLASPAMVAGFAEGLGLPLEPWQRAILAAHMRSRVDEGRS
jgi:hypothetical protein